MKIEWTRWEWMSEARLGEIRAAVTTFSPFTSCVSVNGHVVYQDRHSSLSEATEAAEGMIRKIAEPLIEEAVAVERESFAMMLAREAEGHRAARDEHLATPESPLLPASSLRWLAYAQGFIADVLDNLSEKMAKKEENG